MKWRRASLVLLGAGVACGASASATTDGPVRVAIAPSITVPQGILDGTQTLDLVVYSTSTGAGCDATSGEATGVTTSTSKVATASLGTTNCAATADFCGSLTISESTTPMVFAAEALDANGNVLAYGCTTASVDEDTLAVSITMQRYIPPAVCGDGVIGVGEQCNPPAPEGGTDLVCDSNCHSQEETLSVGATSPQGPAFLLWPAATGANGELMALFAENTGNLDVALRVMSDALEAVSVPTAAASTIIAPNDGQPNGTCTFPPVSAPGDQNEPSATVLGGVYYYAFEDALDIHMRSFDSSLCAQQPIGSPIGINGPGGAGEAGTQDTPSVAANASGSLLIAWRDQSSQQIFARTYDPTADDAGSQLGAQTQISATTGSNENPQVAATSSGWVVAWDDGTQILMQAVTSSGALSGAAIAVSDGTHTGTQDHPGLATLDDGRAAVVWCDHGTSQGAQIFLQRYDATLAPVAGDQATAINNLVAQGEITPAIGSTSAQGGSFMAAWIDSASGQVRGRAIGGSSGFLFNPIDGQTDEFQASIATGVTRENPTVAIGGSGPWVAIGWDDGTAVYARRFPTSTE